MRTYAGPHELAGQDAGQALGHSAWRRVDQPLVHAFADVTGDHQWIHTDPGRAATGPFGTPVAHGFLIASLLPAMLDEVLRVDGSALVLNKGVERLRFTSPVPVGSRVRARVELVDVVDVAGGVQLTAGVTVEIEGSDRPALVAEWLTRRYD